MNYQEPFGWIILFELIVVAIWDLKFKKIPNLVIVINFISFLYLCYAYSHFTGLEHLYWPSGVIVGGVVLFKAKIMGAGDSKLVASLLLLLNQLDQKIFFQYLLASTLLVGLVLIIVRSIKKHRELRILISIWDFKGIWRIVSGSTFSYAPVILLAWMMLKFLP